MGGFLSCCTGGTGSHKDDKVTHETVTVTDGKIGSVKNDDEIIHEQSIHVVESRPVNSASSPTKQRIKAGKITLVKSTGNEESTGNPFSSIPIEEDKSITENGKEPSKPASNIPVRSQKRITIVRDTSNNEDESGTSSSRDYSHSEPFSASIKTEAQSSPRGRVKIVREFEED